MTISFSVCYAVDSPAPASDTGPPSWALIQSKGCSNVHPVFMLHETLLEAVLARDKSSARSLAACKLTCTRKITPKPPVAAQATAALKSVPLGLKVGGSICAR